MNELESQVKFWILSYLLNSLWQVPLLAAAGWLAARSVRRVGAGAEHVVWVCVLFLQALLPALSMLSWSWAGSLWASLSSAHQVSQSGVRVQIGGGRVVSGFQFPAMLLTGVAIGYAAMIACFAVRFIARWMRLMTLRREAAELSWIGDAAREWERCARIHGINEVTVATSSQIFGPVTLGLRRKLVLLPAGMLGSLSDADLRTVVAHEFAHIARNDFVKNLIYELLSLPVLYHPLFLLTRERIMETREMVCDQMAASTAGHDEYARSLLRLAALLVKGMPVRTPHAIGIFDANTFERRVMRLTRRNMEVHGLRRLALVALCVALGAATCGTALAVGLRVDADSGNSTTAGKKNSSPVNVSPEVMQNNILSKVPPVYPVEAKKAGIQGKVVLDAIIGKDGTVENLKVTSGPKELQQSALDAVRQWKYKPLLLNGKAVEVDTTVNVIYTLAK
jgi:TonB family protein